MIYNWKTSGGIPKPPACGRPLFGWHYLSNATYYYLSNAASFVLCFLACQGPAYFATILTTLEENLR